MAAAWRVLLVDDEEAVCWSLRRALANEGYQVDLAATAEAALVLAHQSPPDVVFLDVRLPGMSGLTALEQLRQSAPGAAVIIMTAYGDMGTAVKALHGGAFEYLPKPFDLEQALLLARRATQTPLTGDRTDSPPVAPPDGLLGRSRVMQDVFRRIALVAPRPACVLIGGESGTGKELVARAIHRHSPRASRPFVPLHLGALHPGLVESELFGHVRGAFTGATETRAGLLALADGGTLFLDEVAEIPPAVQVKLLRVLEHGEFVPVGSAQPRPLDVRVLAATHKDLGRMVAEGTFRHDLFYRLNVFPIVLPPLRERLEDLPLLAEYFVRQMEPQSWPLPATTLAFLCRLSWPGNVRELRNALDHACILARGGPLLPEHLPAQSSTPVTGVTPPPEQLQSALLTWLEDYLHQHQPKPSQIYEDLLTLVERVLFTEVLKRVQGNRWEAARWFGLNRGTVRKKLAALGLTPPGDQEAELPESG